MADKKERVVLVVTSVATEKEYQGNPVISFSAHKDGEEHAAGYETWGRELVDQVKKDARLDCEVSYIQKGENTVNRVTQMFDAKGNPIRPPRQRSSGSRNYGKSPEQVILERISIEGQSAYNGVIELIKSGKADEWDKQVETAKEYAEMKMRAGMKPVTLPQPAPAAEKKAEAKSKPPAEKKTPAPSPKITDSMVNQIRKAAKDKGYTNLTWSRLLARFGVNKSDELTVAQGKELLAMIDKGEGLPEGEPTTEQEK
jgi:hypothetical protein